MKVKNNTKAVLTLKAINGSQFSLKPEASHSFKKEELSLYKKAVDAYLKSGWLSEDKSKGEAPKSEEAPQEAPKEEAPKSEEAPKKEAKPAKKTRKARARK